jgi:hypothetical protein
MPFVYLPAASRTHSKFGNKGRKYGTPFTLLVYEAYFL